MALVTTVSTTPLTRWLYPSWYREKVAKWRRGEIDWDGNPLITEAQASETRMEEALDKAQTRRLVLHLRLDALAGLFNLVALLGGAKKAVEEVSKEESTSSAPASTAPPSVVSELSTASRPLEVRGVRLVELTDRTSSVMQSAEVDEFANRDAVFSAFQTFSRLNGVAVAGHVSIIPTSAYAETMAKKADESKSDLMLIPWSTHGGLAEDAVALAEVSSPNDRFFSRPYIEYVQAAVAQAPCTAGVYIGFSHEEASLSKRPTLTRSAFTGLSVHSNNDGSVLSPASRAQHIFVPFVGGRDDRAALLFVLQLAQNPNVSITVVHLIVEDGAVDNETTKDLGEPSAVDLELLSTAKLKASKTLGERVTFSEVVVGSAGEIPERAVAEAQLVVGRSRASAGDLVVVGRRHACFERTVMQAEIGLEREFQKTVGVLGERVARGGVRAGLLVINEKE